MVFSTLVFISLTLTAVFVLNTVVSRYFPVKVSNILLLVASLFMYAWGEPVYVLLLIGVTAANYLFALALRGSGRRKALLICMIAANLVPLCFFKYTNFLLEMINPLIGLSVSHLNLALPIGISFYTFQAMSYSMDVYRGVNEPQRNFFNLLLYISFFPQLMAGPIIKYHDIEPYLTERRAGAEDMARGMRRFIMGLSKKVLIANVLGAAADRVYALPPEGVSGFLALLGALAYAGQIYYDFSGYSDMALGLGSMFGFKFEENFWYPYAAASMRDFWRKWHISLSAWFREYLYIPLGGNRRGKFRAAVNRVIVFFFTGLWHGANWTFVVWGLGHGLLLMLESYGILPVEKLRKGGWRAIAHLYAVASAVLLFVFFRADTIRQALILLKNMFTNWGMPLAQRVIAAELVTPHFLIVFAMAVIGAAPWWRPLAVKIPHSLRPFSYFGSLILLGLCLMSLAVQSHNPFIYFRF